MQTKQIGAFLSLLQFEKIVFALYNVLTSINIDNETLVSTVPNLQ